MIQELILNYFSIFMRLLGVMMPLPFREILPYKIRFLCCLFFSFLFLNSVNVSSQSLIFEFLLGLMIGFIIRLAFCSFEIAASVVSIQIGVGLFYFPEFREHMNFWALFFLLFFIYIFFESSAFARIFLALTESFNIKFPIQESTLALMSFFYKAFAIGLKISLPIVCCLSLTILLIGLISKAAPMFNIFSIGWHIPAAVGFVFLFFFIPILGKVACGILDRIFLNIDEFLQTARGS